MMNHIELITTLGELYTLFVDLGMISAERLRLPDPNTGTHLNPAINKAAALDAGYSPETVEVLSALPYLDVGRHEFMEILPSTYPITYLGDNRDEGYFRGRHGFWNDEEMEPTAIRLTSSAVYGTEFIYDTETKLVRVWETFNNPDDVEGYGHVEAVAPREGFAPMIAKYRELHYLATPNGVEFESTVDFGTGLYAGSKGVPPADWSAGEQHHWRASYEVWKATRRLKDFYLECGWDTQAAKQDRFRLDEFIARRDAHWSDVVEPLISAAQAAWERRLTLQKAD